MPKMTLTQARQELRAMQGNTANKEVVEAIDVVLGTPDEPTFIILTKDRFAVNTVRNWIYATRVLGEEAKGKVDDALDVLKRMADFHAANSDKVKNPE